MSIERILVASTGNIGRDIARFLDDGTYDHLVMWKREEGWLIYVGPNRPLGLAELLDEAKRQDCEWLMLDNGAAPLPGFPTYDW
jgi:hypothetical protein